jgi:hypothetical protein
MHPIPIMAVAASERIIRRDMTDLLSSFFRLIKTVRLFLYPDRLC